MGTHEFILYAYDFPSRAERIIWMLNELALDYQLIRLNPLAGETLKPEFLALNPSRKVPVLVHRGKVYTESVAILVYLACLRPEAKLLPATTVSAAVVSSASEPRCDESYHVWRAISYGLSEVEPYLWIADQCTRLNRLYHWPEATLEEALTRIEGAIQHLYDLVGSRDFIAGSHFSIADIYVHHILGWSRAYEFKPPEKVLAYMKRLAQRPGYPSNLKNSQEAP